MSVSTADSVGHIADSRTPSTHFDELLISSHMTDSLDKYCDIVGKVGHPRLLFLTATVATSFRWTMLKAI